MNAQDLRPRKMPIGIQDFEKIRTGNYLYVDKTAYVHRLAEVETPYFLGRPRRFGKSLLLSTLKAYFEGKRELFEGTGERPALAVAALEKDWVKYPVFHFDFNFGLYTEVQGLISVLNYTLRCLEDEWGAGAADDTPPARLLALMHRAREKTGNKVVVLVDEYDKPLIETMDNLPLQEEMRKVLKSFYGVLKTADPVLRLAFLTGVTKFSQVSIFSDLNQLRDISMEDAYSGICGISAEELTGTFKPDLEALAEKSGKSYEETVTEMHKRYNGYHFSENSEGMFNPFSVLNTLVKFKLEYYWFKTGTPTFLVKALKDMEFDFYQFSDGIPVQLQAITDYRAGAPNLIPLLYQSGYLTIVNYDPRMDLYTLGFPNDEVRYGFLYELALVYSPGLYDKQGFLIHNFVNDLQTGNLDGFMNRLRAFIADIPYDLRYDTEKYYQNIFYLFVKLMGALTQAEVRSSAGRADMVVTTDSTVFVFEFKLAKDAGREDDLLQAALNQIDAQGYLVPYSAGTRKLVKVAAVFNSETRTLGAWQAVLQSP
jgi:hypothetical protein